MVSQEQKLASNLKTVGELIRERRKRKGWSQTVLGDMVGMSAATVHRVEHGEKIPTDQEAMMIAGMLGVDHEEMMAACNLSREKQPVLPKSSFKTKWDNAHPASYSGAVWIQVKAQDENRHLPHEFSLRWGVWERKGSLNFEGQESLYLAHYKQNDGLGLPMFFSLSHPCYVVFGKGDAPSEPVIDINFGWKRVEPPEAGQLWRYTWHYLKWYVRKLFRMKS